MTVHNHPAGVQNFTQTTDLPSKTGGSDPAPVAGDSAEGSAKGKLASVQEFDIFMGSKKGNVSVPSSSDNVVDGGSAKGEVADVDRDFKRLP